MTTGTTPTARQILRPAASRGRMELSWLEGRYSFSFGRYRDPAWDGFGVLRVINDDIIAPAGGFDTHPHHDMEIISYVLEGAIEHRDSTGGGGVIRPGDVQRMSAGTGVRHSEFNPSKADPTRMLQIWIIPDRAGREPRYGQITVDPAQTRGALRLVASPDGADGSLAIYQDARMFAGRFDGAESQTLAIAPGRKSWAQVARGEVTVNGQRLREGDGLAMDGVEAVAISEGNGAEVLVFDLPA